MFTGIVEALGHVAEAARSDGGMRISVAAQDLDLKVGDSIAVNGVCLTVIESRPGGFDAYVVLETLAKSNLGELQPDSTVNLERPMRADGRFDGHLVQGHVDGIGVVVAVEPEGDGTRIRVQLPTGLSRYVAVKGSIAVDGVSLTVAAAAGDEFEVALIPHTLEVTTLGVRPPGSHVNLEVDVIAKYVERMLSGRAK